MIRQKLVSNDQMITHTSSSFRMTSSLPFQKWWPPLKTHHVDQGRVKSNANRDKKNSDQKFKKNMVVMSDG